MTGLTRILPDHSISFYFNHTDHSGSLIQSLGMSVVSFLPSKDLITGAKSHWYLLPTAVLLPWIFCLGSLHGELHACALGLPGMLALPGSLALYWNEGMG